MSDRHDEVRPEATLVGRPRSVALAGGGRIEIEDSGPCETVRIRTAEGACAIAIEMTPAGPVITLRGVDVELSAARTLRLSAPELVVEAGSARLDVAGDLVERIAGEARRHVRGACEVKAGSMALCAVDTSLTLRANDDVDVRGERVRLNCDEAPMPMSLEEFRARRAIAAAGGGASHNP